VRTRLILALTAGVALWLAFPSHDLWPLAPVGVGLLALATRDVSARRGLLLGLVTGLAFFLPVLSWSGIYVGKTPWLALAVLESLYIGLVGWASALLQRAPSLAGAPRVRPVVIALLWVAQEALRDRTPFGGFPWARLAFSQADSPLVHLAALGGAPAVTFGVALVGAVGAAAVSRLGWVGSGRGVTLRGEGRPVSGLGRAVPVGALAGALLFVPLVVPTPTDGHTARFMAVQGNVPEPGLDFNAERRAVLDDHVAVTRAAAKSVAAGAQPRPDLVVWPENSSDIDPLRNADAAVVINDALTAIDAPIVVGAVLEGPGEHITNASLLYRPGQGVTQRYVKQHPVPFAEYIPFRSFFRHLSDKVDLVRWDMAAGSGAGVFRVPDASGGTVPASATSDGPGAPSGGTIAAGPVICFEVAYDDLMRHTVRAGANVLLVQTNNATFGYTDESEQQLAISRVRAVEHGRSIVHVSTVGVSALITPDGTAHQRSALFTSALLAGDLPLRSVDTVADRVGAWPEYLACGAVLLMLLRLLLRGVPRRRR
jgi:apolipoprotein N-acyltransferase